MLSWALKQKIEKQTNNENVCRTCKYKLIDLECKTLLIITTIKIAY